MCKHLWHVWLVYAGLTITANRPAVAQQVDWRLRQLYAELDALVGQKEELLVEAPRITFTPLSLGSRQLVSAFTNSGQVFQCDDKIVSFGELYQLIADDVIHMRLKAPLPKGGFAGEASPANTPPRQPSLKFSTPTPTTSRASRGFLLEICSQVCVMISNLCYLFPVILVPLRGYCDVCSTQIHTQNFIRFLWQFWVRLKLNIYVIATIQSLHQRRCFWSLSFQQTALVITNSQFKPSPTSEQPQTDRPVVLSEAEHSLIIGSRRWCELQNVFVFLLGCSAVASNSRESHELPTERTNQTWL